MGNRPLQKTNSKTGETPIPQELWEKSNAIAHPITNDQLPISN
ncbi:hypothetical protein [Microseira wollei]|nr:hypothetical protein [Microseira wollei]